MPPINRRTFLKSSALSAPAVAGAAGLLASTAARATAEKPEPAGGGATYRLTREIPVEAGYDLVVAGGGPAGAAAAISAARLGAKVVLVEAAGSLGGMGSNALVSDWFGLGDGRRLVVGGLFLDLVHALCREKQVPPNVYECFQKGHYFDALGFNPEALKMLLDKLCQRAGVELRFCTRVIDADADPTKGRVRGVVTNSVEGYRCLRGAAFIDATGDAVLADLCGAQARAAGRDTPNIMPPTLCAMVADIDFERLHVGQQQAMVEKAIADGFFTQPDRHVPGLFRSGATTATMNAGHLFHADALKTRSLSDALVLGRRLVEEYANFYRKYMPGCEKMLVVGTGSLLGVRESRRIVGEYELNYADFQARRHFADQIALGCHSVDIHVYDLGAAEYRRYHEEFTKADRLKAGESYGIPYGVLVPKGWSNLWVAGRCASSDIKVHGAIRDQPSCSMMGQAAGTAAVQSIRTGQPANDLDTQQLVLTLRQAGANLPQPQTSKTMTRGA
jgi:hypothetical protein